jgi:hypothetical protein
MTKPQAAASEAAMRPMSGSAAGGEKFFGAGGNGDERG